MVSPPTEELPDSLLHLLTSLLWWLDTWHVAKLRTKSNKCMDLLCEQEQQVRFAADYTVNSKEKIKGCAADSSLKVRRMDAQLDDLPPDHPLNVQVMGS